MGPKSVDQRSDHDLFRTELVNLIEVMGRRKEGGSVATILFSTVASLILLAGAVYAFWQWFSHSGELGDKEKYAASQIADNEHKDKFTGKFLVLRNVGSRPCKIRFLHRARERRSRCDGWRRRRVGVRFGLGLSRRAS